MRALVVLLALMFALLTQLEAGAFKPNIWREFGNEHGLTDTKGREIVPAIYPDIYYWGRGLFLLRARTGTFACSQDRILINRNGVRLNPKLTQGATFEKPFWLGKQSDSDRTLVLNKVPSDALFVFRSGEYLGVCDAEGSVILPAGFTDITDSNEGCAALRQKDDQVFLFDGKTRKQQPVDKVRWNTLLSQPGEGSLYFMQKQRNAKAHYANLSKTPWETFREIAPGILLKTIECPEAVYEEEMRKFSSPYNRFH